MSGVTMYKPHYHKNILAPYQFTILESFFAAPFADSFFLTGGTALAAFYFGHRESKDFDLFTLTSFDPYNLNMIIDQIAQKTNSKVFIKVKTDTYNEIYLQNRKEGWIQRIDFVRDQPKRFGRITKIKGINVDSLENIATNKILTLYSRLEPKDYIDFYIIITKTPLKFDTLFAMAKQKDTGLFEFYFAHSIANIDKIETWPEIKVKLDKKKMIGYYQKLSRDLLLKIKPKE